VAKFVDQTGNRYNRWTFVRRVEGRRWLCRCDCGVEKALINDSVSRGKTKSCGCLGVEVMRARHAAIKPTPEQRAATRAAYLERTKARRAAQGAEKHRKMMEDPVRREAWRERGRRLYAADPEQVIRRERAKYSTRKEATPAWANIDAIKALYVESRRLTQVTGERHHVDHTVPLRNKLVCGLHCEANMRVLPAVENWRKHNKLDLGEESW
jgi:hypothetical protein